MLFDEEEYLAVVREGHYWLEQAQLAHTDVEVSGEEEGRSASSTNWACILRNPPTHLTLDTPPLITNIPLRMSLL